MIYFFPGVDFALFSGLTIISLGEKAETCMNFQKLISVKTNVVADIFPIAAPGGDFSEE